LLRVIGTDGQPPATAERRAAEAGCLPYTVGRLVNQARQIAVGRPASQPAGRRPTARRPDARGHRRAVALYDAGLTARVLHPATVLLAMHWFGAALRRNLSDRSAVLCRAAAKPAP
jgi:hypothetical protein